MGRLFGTDGVRGVANQELTPELAFRLGQAAAVALAKEMSGRPQILIGKDTRISSDMLEFALSAGVCSVGGDVVSLGVIPTPAVAYLVRQRGAAAGAVISASHNPFEHNGIKFFSGKGYKLSDSLEDDIEAQLHDGAALHEAVGAQIGRALPWPEAASSYIDYLASTSEGALAGLRVAVDCANGAASVTAPPLFEKLGCETVFKSCTPDGLNINTGCGSTHLDSLSAFVRELKCDIGVAFDGDADRMLAVDETGAPIDGDRLLALFALCLWEQGRLPHGKLVATTMSNLGLHIFAKERGLSVAVTDVGDRYVLEEMLRGGYTLGGEQSGHIILSDLATTGDGELAAVFLLNLLRDSGKKASELRDTMQALPQAMQNVHVENTRKAELASHPAVLAAVKSCEEELHGEGRVLLRPSGTEPLVRVMAEGRDIGQVRRIVKTVAAVIEEAMK